MEIKSFIRFNAIVGFTLGIPLLIAPAILLSLFGAPLDASGALMARFYGAELIGFNIATWIASGKSGDFQHAIIFAHFVSESLTFLIALVAIVTGVVNLLGWVVVAITLVFSAGFGYFQFNKPR